MPVSDYMPSDSYDAGVLARYFDVSGDLLRRAKEKKLGYPESPEPTQGVTAADIPAQTGERPNPSIIERRDVPASREEMVAANIQRAMGRDRGIMGSMVPGSFTQEQFLKELEGIKSMTGQAPAAPSVAADRGFSEVLGEAKTFYDPEKGQYVAKWDLSKVDPRYGYQSAEAIESYLSRAENYPQLASTPQQSAERAAKETPVPAAPARAAAAEAAGAGREDQIRYGERAIRGGKNVFWSGDPNYGFQSAGSIQKLKEEKFRQNVLLPMLLGKNPPAGVRQFFGMGK